MANSSKSSFSSATIFNTLWKFILFNLAIATVLSLVFCAKCFLTLEGIVNIMPDFLFSFLMSSSLSLGGFKVEEFFDKRMSWIDYPVKRLVLTAGVYLIYTFVVSFVLSAAYALFTIEGLTIHNISWVKVLSFTDTPILIAMVIIAIFISRSWLFEWRNAAIEAEQLKSEKLASQNQFLKDQLNPHFLFNSLNVLSNLVYESADRSAEFIQQLSKIYRYVLDVQQEQLVSLKRELDFAEHYLSLQKIRFENSLEYFIDVQPSQALQLPPLSLQLLLENAIKHNIASMEKPLRIMIQQEGTHLVVRNVLQPKITKEDSVKGIGLENITKRYELLSEVKPSIQQTETEFIVKLPLLKLDGNPDH